MIGELPPAEMGVDGEWKGVLMVTHALEEVSDPALTWPCFQLVVVVVSGINMHSVKHYASIIYDRTQLM